MDKKQEIIIKLMESKELKKSIQVMANDSAKNLAGNVGFITAFALLWVAAPVILMSESTVLAVSLGTFALGTSYGIAKIAQIPSESYYIRKYTRLADSLKLFAPAKLVREKEHKYLEINKELNDKITILEQEVKKLKSIISISHLNCSLQSATSEHPSKHDELKETALDVLPGESPDELFAMHKL